MVRVHLALVRGDAYAALASLVAEVTCTNEVTITRACPQCGSSSHGRPTALAGGESVAVSLARPTADAGVALIAVSRDQAIGVDLEARDAGDFPGFDAVTLHPAESAEDAVARTRAWVRKEALLKAHGTGLAIDPRRVRLSPQGQILAGPPGVIVDLELPAPWLGSVATCPADDLQISWR